MKARRGRVIQVAQNGWPSIRGESVYGIGGGYHQGAVSLRCGTKQNAPPGLLFTHYTGFATNSFVPNTGWIGPRKSQVPGGGGPRLGGPQASLFMVSESEVYELHVKHEWATFGHSAYSNNGGDPIFAPMYMAILCIGLRPGTSYRVMWSEQEHGAEGWTPGFEPVYYTEFTAEKGWHCLFGSVNKADIYEKDGTINRDDLKVYPTRKVGGFPVIEPGKDISAYWVALGSTNNDGSTTTFPGIEATYSASMTGGYPNKALKGTRV
ncbi:MAG: hypothetical protein LBV12_06355 [Puniceicoccales bacterium]|jgi:hypothetical protein|nr:hypothetical protein [Puniceicoccales bacterium]